ncbi:histidine-specific methyltransferase [Schizophyllum amplum]|uniref:Histidine-specific methyltransferase n=1 Tax=Schizophyllum amplum TaxID=97359 RepID=A0A550BZD6_9AGAR|nr:histidine-specific methyltransferase [Auriculariopsis ampla]
MPAEILDVHLHDDGVVVDDVHRQVLDGLTKPAGQKQLPTMLLYDERGLRLYDTITTDAKEYYLFGAEEEILKGHSDEIVRAMHGGRDAVDGDEVVLELGAGALRKTSHILSSLARLVPEQHAMPPITYYALDLEQNELQRTLDGIASCDVGTALEGRVATKGMWGTYDGGVKFVQSGGLLVRGVADRLSTGSPPVSCSTSTSRSPSQDCPRSLSSCSSGTTDESSMPATPQSTNLELSGIPADSPPLHLLFLGSSLGNFDRASGAAFLKALPLRQGAGDTLLLGMDHDNDKTRVEEAYNDSEGHTKRFIMNGLHHAGRLLGDEAMFDDSKWDYVNRYNVDERRHEAFLVSKVAQTVYEPETQKEYSFLPNEKVKIEESFKFSEADAYSLFTYAGLRPIHRWTDSARQYSLWLLERPAFVFPLLKTPSAAAEDDIVLSTNPSGIPSLSDWRTMWSCWDTITLTMIPEEMLLTKPIDLRHVCLFYLGHIPTFLDIFLSRYLQEPHTEPESFKTIFERGIDPDVDDPTQCHDHSEVPERPEDWPSLGQILEFEKNVRQRLISIYEGVAARRIPLTTRLARVLTITYEHEAMHAETLLYMLLMKAGEGLRSPKGFASPPWDAMAKAWDATPEPETKTVTLGPAEVKLGHEDDEALDAEVGEAEVRRREFGWDNEHPVRTEEVGKFRMSWRPISNGEFYAYWRERQGTVPLPPSWMPPTKDEAYDAGDPYSGMRVRTLHGPVHMKYAHHWPVMASYDMLSTYAVVRGGRLPTEPELRMFYDKFECGYEGGANVGFRHWHPVPPRVVGGEGEAMKVANGGVWEWTSTVFERVEGFKPSVLYPGYSQDFFDGRHNVVLGGSYATIPRLAGRRSLCNWYQRNYQYPWVGARIVYDA